VSHEGGDPRRQRSRIHKSSTLSLLCPTRDNLYENKEKLREQYEKLNPAEIQRQIIKLQEKLIEKVLLKEELRKSMRNNFKKGERFSYDYV